MESIKMIRMESPISEADLAHYHSELVMVTAMMLANSTESDWAMLTQRARARWLDRSLNLLVGVLSIFAYNAFMVRIGNLSALWREWTDELLVQLATPRTREGSMPRVAQSR